MFKKISLTPFYPVLLLPIPFIGMQFSNEVHWSLFDFILMGLLLLALGFGIHLIIKKTNRLNQKIILITLTILLFLFIWAELAVGIVGSPFAGT
ncbi:hypothetical protein N9H57_03290 [Flavobacteriaceae bacterium]|nr:hypothetical protein [Flavobacteriaceae bacterium]MDA9015496.1 hypothetical protein [Flavobacteriaceae bacterium]MDB3862480.1 hypothetical protein [Flavobacteriaceae bacterium]MDC3354192.1 hypothetical protein [Flavobacteriaceae bacterium]